MKPDTVLRKFTNRKGREVTLRTPRWSDLDDMLSMINSLVEEEAMIAFDNHDLEDSLGVGILTETPGPVPLEAHLIRKTCAAFRLKQNGGRKKHGCRSGRDSGSTTASC